MMGSVAPLVLSPSEIRQLRHFCEDLKARHLDAIRTEDFEDAHYVLTQLLRPLRTMLIRQEWRLGSEAASAW